MFQHMCHLAEVLTWIARSWIEQALLEQAGVESRPGLAALAVLASSE
jgi:hypothetical protein